MDRGTSESRGVATSAPGARRVLGTMLRQFWWVAAIAVVWAAFTFDREQPFASLVKQASGAAFLMMYFAGQYLRVGKQIADSDAQERADVQLGALRDELGDIRDKVSRGDDLLRTALRARRLENELELLEALASMVTLAIRLPETGSDIDAISLWWPHPHGDSWEILASDGVSHETRTSFRQMMLEEREPGAGIVANLAAPRERNDADGADVFIASDARAHDWFAPDPHRRRESIGMAAVLLRNRRLEPIGAVCVTSARAGAVPRARDVEARSRLEDTLLVWQIAFTLPLERLLELRHA